MTGKLAHCDYIQLNWNLWDNFINVHSLRMIKPWEIFLVLGDTEDYFHVLTQFGEIGYVSKKAVTML